ncbi:MAG: SAM-dependent methyltransferase, partial [Candidatus Sulfotelmatobacter sp.]
MPKTISRTGVPIVKISPRGASRLKDGHIWVYRSDVVSADGAPAGSLVSVVDHRGQPLGDALYSSSSQIAIRLISHEPVVDFPGLLRQRVANAIAYRKSTVHNTNA